MNIKSIKLVTGEDIICDYSKSESGMSILTDPVQVTMVPSRTGNQPNFGFIPFPLTSNDKTIVVSSDHIVFVCDPAEEFISQYKSIFGVGIITPPSGVII